MRLPAFTIIAMFAVIGCHRLSGKKKQAKPQVPTSAPAPVVNRAVGSFRPPPAPVLPVKQGPPPLAYIVERGGTIRVADQETGMTIAAANVSPGIIVSVDEKAGVRAGGVVLVKGPLSSGRMYQIYLETDDDNVMHQQHIYPGR